MYPIKVWLETKTTVHQFYNYLSIHSTGWKLYANKENKNPDRRIVPLFSIKNYETDVTTFGSGLKFILPSVYPDTHMR